MTHSRAIITLNSWIDDYVSVSRPVVKTLVCPNVVPISPSLRDLRSLATRKGCLNEKAQRPMISLYFQPKPVHGVPA